MSKKKRRIQNAPSREISPNFPANIIPEKVEDARRWFSLAMIFPFLIPLVVIGYFTIVLRRSYFLQDGTAPWLDSIAFTFGGITFTWVAYVLATLAFLLAVVFWLELRRRKFRRLEWAFVFCSSALFFSFLSLAFLRVYARLNCPLRARQALFTAIDLSPDPNVAAIQHWVFSQRTASEYSASGTLIVRDQKNSNNPVLNILFKNQDEIILTLDALVRPGFVTKEEQSIDVIENSDERTVNRRVVLYRVTPRGLSFYRHFLRSRNLGAPDWLITPVHWHAPTKPMEDVSVPLPEYYSLPKARE